MAQYETEEQQVEAIKNFWKENGTAIVLGAVIGFGGLFGWNYFQDYKKAQSENASAEYAQVIKLIKAGDETNTAFVEAAEKYKADYSSSNYASLAALKVAQQYVSEKKLEQAAEQLQWVVDQSNSTFEAVAQLRLARVLLEQDKYDAAVASVEAIESDVYLADAKLVKGEALLAQGKTEEAKNAYIEAQQATKGFPSPMLRMRLAEFGIENK